MPETQSRAPDAEKAPLPVAEATAALHVQPGDLLCERWQRPAKGHKPQSVDAVGKHGEKLHALGEVEQVVHTFAPDFTALIMAKSRRRLRYEQVAPVWVA